MTTSAEQATPSPMRRCTRARLNGAHTAPYRRIPDRPCPVNEAPAEAVPRTGEAHRSTRGASP
ncbi:hypothetical protein GCM10010315_26960 [Streptomyces luteosporeus]|uniref:Uncharacterized protein n=1 Tax=Streptomyces luteosporeus TaxID=173856 RepID=A0ABP6G5I0_9ACTN